MLESRIEGKLRREVEKRGGRARKFVSPGWAGAPDRIVLIPGGRIIFVETKAPEKIMRPLQKKRATELRGLGFKVYKLDSLEGVREFVTEVFPE